MLYLSTTKMTSIKCLLLILSASSAFGMDCSWIGSNRFEDQLLHSCPRIETRLGTFGDPSKSYCCPTQDGSFECCDFAQFISTPPFDTLFLIAILVVILVVGCVIFACCMFCCCSLCRTRSRGRVLYQANAGGV